MHVSYAFMQGMMLLYLTVAWPYLLWQLQALELIAHALETVIIVFGMLQMGGSGDAYMTWAMIGRCCCNVCAWQKP